MPIRDGYLDMDKHGKARNGTVTAQPLTMPLSKTDWHLRRAFKARRCDFSGDIILPLAKAYRQQVFWGLSNAETHEELEEKWLSPASYTFKKLSGTL